MNSATLAASYRMTPAVTRISELDWEKPMVCLGDCRIYGGITVSVYTQRSVYMKLWFYQHYCMQQRRGPWVCLTQRSSRLHAIGGKKMLQISWKDMITNKTVRERTGQNTLESIIREWRLRWFGHIYRLDSSRIARQVMDWTLPHFRR